MGVCEKCSGFPQISLDWAPILSSHLRHWESCTQKMNRIEIEKCGSELL